MNQMTNLICTKTLQTKHMTFKEGETYQGYKLNRRWWVIDAIGVSADDFGKNFVMQEDTQSEELDAVTEE
jgi:hypothetical protein